MRYERKQSRGGYPGSDDDIVDGGIVKFDYKMLLPQYESKYKANGRGEEGGEGGSTNKSRTKPRKRLASGGA